jgi:hypothetical protein
MSTDPRYIPGSLRNLPLAGDRSAGFRFVFRTQGSRSLYYVTHRMTLTVDGVAIPGEKLRLTRNGVTVRASDLVRTDWVPLEGESIEVAAEHPGGLGPGRHRIRLQALFGGVWGSARAAIPTTLCDFEAEIASAD